MNSQQRFEQMCGAMMDDVRPQEQDFADAYEVGRLDAEDDLECDPLKWFYDLDRVEQYVLGWRDGMHVDDTAEYIDDRLDREWHARGEW